MLFVNRDGSGYLSTRDIDVRRTVRSISSSEVEVYLRWLGLPARPRASYADIPALPAEGDIAGPNRFRPAAPDAPTEG
jgi:hypothetical protein